MSEQLGRMLLVAGAVLVGAGLLVLVAGRVGVGRLPGDIVWRGEKWSVYIPLGWMILLSLLLTVILNIVGRR